MRNSRSGSEAYEVTAQTALPDEPIARLTAALNCVQDAVIGRDESGKINLWNTAAGSMFGYAPEEVMGHSMLLLVPPELLQEELANWERLGRGVPREHYRTRLLKRGGEPVEVWASACPIRDRTGRILGSALIAYALDAFQREHAAQARLAAVVESSDDAIVAKDLNGIVTDWNAAAERIFGYTAPEMIGRSIFSIIPPDLRHEEPIILSRIRAGERVEHYETQRLHKSGKRIDVSLTLSSIRDANGQVIGVSKIARDISERRRAENERMLLGAIVESSGDAIITKTLDGVITSWNAAARRMFGYESEEIIGQPVLRLIPPELHFEEPQILLRLRSGHPIDHYETRRMRKNGEVFDVSLTVSPVKNSQGRVIGASKIVRDISQRKAAEVLLMQKEKQAAAGRMAHALAHEVNNPLQSITNLAYLLAEHPSLDGDARAFARLLLNEVQRANDISRQTISYYCDSRFVAEVDVAETIEHVLQWKESKLQAKHIVLEKQLGGIGLVKGIASELRQIFETLIENAIEAVGEGGRIRVRIRTRDRSGTLAISVCDNGAGIPRSLSSTIFEPFVTPKSQRGHNVAMWVTHGLVQKHGGSIRVHSSVTSRRGAVVTVVLPLSRTLDSQQRESAAKAA